MVFGAGVSHEYGYPVGTKLLSEIKGELKGNEHEKTSRAIYDSLVAMNPYSIDYFLSKKPNFADPVKRLILRRLMLAEAYNVDLIKTTVDASGVPQEHDTIYKKLFNSISERDYDRLVVISFNYDRSFEHYFLRALMAQHELTIEQAYDRFKKIRVVHVYGRLPSLSEQIEQDHGILISSPNQYWSCAYGKYEQQGSMRSNLENYAVERLFTVHEEENKKKEGFRHNLRTIRGEIRHADRVFFLGFGYHDLNMDVLGFKESHTIQDIYDEEYRAELKKKFIVGTAWGMGGVERNRVLKTYPIKHLTPCSNLQFFDDHVSLTNDDWNVLL